MRLSTLLKSLVYLSLFIGGPQLVHAETLITDGYLATGAYWEKSGSPFILEDDVYVPPEYSLYIGPGVEIRTASSSTEKKGINAQGGVFVDGHEGEPVTIDNVYGITLGRPASTVNFARFKNFTRAIHDNAGEVTIRNSVFSGGQTGVGLRKATSSITNSVFKNVNESVHIFSSGGIFQVNSGDFSASAGVGGIGNALDEGTTSSITLRDNVISGTVGVKNDSTTIIDARNNWWGSKDGPSALGASKAGSLVMTSPWLDADPRDKVVCCSNVLFIPGIEASRLQVDEHGIFGTSTNRLWEPNRNDDVRKLYLDTQGEGLLPNVYTTGIIDSAFGFGIYKNFIKAMDSLVTAGTLHAWESYPYDWRKSIDSVVDETLVGKTIAMASSSLTGKVTIIAHSNGGLVAKLLVKKLQDKGLSELVDKVLLVAVPELGTPQALSALLHGDGQSLGWGAILTKSVAQKLAMNMPSAYSLLPSLEYFNKIFEPLVSLASSTISSFEGFKNFLGIGGVNSGLLGKGFALHDVIDTWKFPSSITTVSIAESGVKTPQVLRYGKGTLTGGHTTQFTHSGDGTVVLPSAIVSGKDRYVFDGNLIGVDHANILQSASVLSALTKEIGSQLTYEPFEQYLLTDIHKYDNDPIRTIAVHSPVELHAYDSNGGHTGKIPNPNPDSDFEYYEENAKGIQFEIVDGDEVLLLDSPTSTATIMLKGTGVGSFMLDDEIYQNGSTTSYTAFAELPVTPLLSARFEIGTSTATTTGGVLRMDIDGDGKDDVTATSGTAFDPQLHLKTLRQVVTTLNLSSAIEKQLLKRIDAVITDISKGKIQQAKKILTSFESGLDRRHILRKKLSEKDRQQIILEVETILRNLEVGN